MWNTEANITLPLEILCERKYQRFFDVFHGVWDVFLLHVYIATKHFFALFQIAHRPTVHNLKSAKKCWVAIADDCAVVLLSRADPACRFGGPTDGSSPNPTYPQIRISPRISATLFRKYTKIKNRNINKNNNKNRNFGSRVPKIRDRLNCIL